MTDRILDGLRSRWAVVRRHQRLNFAVVGCLTVMFGLVVGLVVAVRVIDARTEDSLGESQEWSAMSVNSLDMVRALGGWSAGPIESRLELERARDPLTADLATIDADAHPELHRDLSRLLDDVAKLINAPTIIDASVATEAIALGSGFESLAGDFGELAGSTSHDSLSDLDRWFWWIQAVAVVSAVVFSIVVGTVILPLSRSIERSLDKLREWRGLAARESRTRRLTVQVADGLDVAETEEKAYSVVARAFADAIPTLQSELLLADSSQAHLRVAVEHPVTGAPGCGVVSPWSCPAVRRGSTMVFDDSQGIRSCPHLARHGRHCSAVCSPLTFMGQPMGVLHATAPVGETPSDDTVGHLAMLATETATRIGTLRAFARAELQAATDVLTGLPNRRATEEQLRQVLAAPDGGAIGLLEIDGLVGLNERYGKATGDRALKVVAESLQFSNRGGDFVGRWAGAEFVIVLAGRAANHASGVVGRVHADLVQSLRKAEIPELDIFRGVADTTRAKTARGLIEAANEALLVDRAGDGGAPLATADQG